MTRTLKKIQKREYIFCLYIIWILFCIFGFDRYAFEIDELNAKSRNFIRTGSFNIRYFDRNGIPITVDGREKREIISPFYVVHYGMQHSILAKNPSWEDKKHWIDDPSLKYWNIPPERLNLKQFKINSDWVVDNVVYFKDRLHLLYNFDWNYNNYENGRLKAPWWSGLTDGYAIILMLRAYDAFGDEKYLNVAKNLYKSVTTPIEMGGSLHVNKDSLWIEEYVDPKANSKNMSRVLNGMIYSYYGINSFESIMPQDEPISERLKDSIIKNLPSYDLGHWSRYDAIGDIANIKYHRINLALIKDPQFNSQTTNKIITNWEIGSKNPGFYWIIYGVTNVSKIHFIFLFFVALIIPVLIVMLCKQYRRLL